jgi:RNA polymerase sigma-70 factor (ECF subfamily)
MTDSTIDEHVEDPRVFLEDFDAFYARERASVVGLAYVLSGSRAAAEDLAQEAFIKALRHWDRISDYDDPGAWVRRVVSNQAVSGYRRRSAEARALVRLGGEPPVPDIAQEAALVWEEVRRLPRRQAQVIALRYLDGRRIEEVARILECSENTVKTHLMRAKTGASRAAAEGANR